MKSLPSICLCLMAAASTAPPCDAREDGRLPEIILDRQNEFPAELREIPDAAGKGDSSHTRWGFAFRSPRLFDGPVTWIVAWDEEKPGTEPWQVISEDGSTLKVVHPVPDDLAHYPELAKRFPNVKSVQRLRIPREQLDESRHYQAVLKIGGDARPPLGVSVNASSTGAGAPSNGMNRRLNIPTGWIPSPLVMELVEQIRALNGDAAAADFLEAQFAKKQDRPDEFKVLFSKVWNEAQFGTGHTDSTWGSKLNDAAFSSAYRAGYYAEAFSIMNNLYARLGGAGRFGRMAEVHGIMREAYRSGGMNMEISSYPDLGPAIPGLPEVRHRKMSFNHAFPEKFPNGPPAITRPETFGTDEAGAFLSYGWQKILRGEWRDGLEWTAWLRDWASDENGAPLQARAGIWYDASKNIAEILAHWGFEEEALAMIDGALAAPYGRNYRNRAKISLAVRQLDQMREIGRPDPEMIPKLRALAAQIEDHLHFGKSDHWRVKTVLANALFHEGSQQEGEQILDQIISEGSSGARHARLAHWIKIGRIDGVEAELIALLRLGRENGHKITEIYLYDMYADFLEKTGRYEEALAMRREAIRLCRDFNMVHRLPCQLAKLAKLLQTIGDEEGRKNASAEALALLPDGGFANSYHTQAKELLAALKPAADPRPSEKPKEPEIDLQPRRSLVVPLAGIPWKTYLALSNPGTVQEHGRLQITGAAAEMSMAGNTNDILIRLADGIGGDGKTIDITLDPATYRLVEISGSASFEAPRDLELLWIAANKRNTTGSAVRIDQSETGVAGAIIEAGVYQANPFYGVPIHLTYASNTPAETSPPLRFVTSQRARVELYKLDGTPLAIDGQGNGSLLNSGDELFGQSDGAGNPVVPLAEGGATFRVVVYPEAPIAEEGLQLDVEVFSDGKWSLHSRNRIEP